MITALDQATLDAAQAAQQSAAYTGDPTLFAAQLAQVLAAQQNPAVQTASSDSASNAVNAATAPQSADPNIALAAQIQTNLAAQAAAQAQMPADQAHKLSQDTVLQSLNFQASVALSNRDGAAFTAIQVMIAQQMAAMNPTQATQAQASSSPSSTTAGATPAATKKYTGVALTKIASPASTTQAASNASTAKSATASNASTSSSSTVQTASNASTTGSATASNASTSSSSSAQSASNASTAGSATAAASNAGTGGNTADNQGMGAVDFMTGILDEELAALSGDDLASALDDVAALADAWKGKSTSAPASSGSTSAGNYLIDALASEIAGLSSQDRTQALDQLAGLAAKWGKAV